MNYALYLRGKSDYLAGSANALFDVDYRLGYSDGIAENLKVGDGGCYYLPITVGSVTISCLASGVVTASNFNIWELKGVKLVEPLTNKLWVKAFETQAKKMVISHTHLHL